MHLWFKSLARLIILMAKRRRKLDGHRYWRFEPDPVLTGMKHHTAKKIASIQKKLIDNMPEEGMEISHEDRVNLHPLLRERLPAGSRRADFSRVAESLEHARRLSEAGLSGAQFYPAVVDTSLFTKMHRPNDIYSFRAFLEIPGEEHRLIMPTTYVMPKTENDYFIEAHGMQRADERETIPRGLHRVFDIGAPALGLSLTSALLRKSGAGKIGMPGHTLQWARKGTKRPQSHKELMGHASSKMQDPAVREGLQEILDHWNDWGGVKVRQKLSELREKTGRHFINAYGIPKVVLERNYKRIPESLGGRSVTASEALGPDASAHMLHFWGYPEPDALLNERAYDFNLEKFDSLHPYLKPMTKKEVSDWKQKMRDNGHGDIDEITPVV
jgi:hypothetical protein